jgi:ribosome-binding protein aMBF1 (putative translation factor)
VTCAVCGDAAGIEHHVSYQPEETVRVCRSCHNTIHSHHAEHGLEPDYTSVERTRTKRAVTLGVDALLVARLERMVLEEGLDDLNHAIETLRERHMTDAETDVELGLYYSITDGKAKHGADGAWGVESGGAK